MSLQFRVKELEDEIKHLKQRLDVAELYYHPPYEPPKPKTPPEVRLVFVFGTILIFLHLIHLLVTTWIL